MSISRWKYEKPANKYKDLLKLYGKATRVENSSKHGYAFWDRDVFRKFSDERGQYYRMTIKDQEVPHNDPKPHVDFLTGTIRVYIPKDKLLQIVLISDSMWYDPLLCELNARCSMIEPVVATLSLALDVLTGELDIKTIKKQNLYAKRIGKCIDDPIYCKELEVENADILYDLQNRIDYKSMCKELGL